MKKIFVFFITLMISFSVYSKDFFAENDNSLKEIFNKVSAEDAVYLKENIYKFSGKFPSKIKLIGRGKVIFENKDNKSIRLNSNEIENIIFKNFKGEEGFLQVRGGNSIIKNCIFENNKVSIYAVKTNLKILNSKFVNNKSVSIYAFDSSLSIEKNKFKKNRICIAGFNSKLEINNNIFQQSKEDAIDGFFCSELKIEKNKFEKNKIGIKINGLFKQANLNGNEYKNNEKNIYNLLANKEYKTEKDINQKKEDKIQDENNKIQPSPDKKQYTFEESIKYLLASKQMDIDEFYFKKYSEIPEKDRYFFNLDIFDTVRQKLLYSPDIFDGFFKSLDEKDNFKDLSINLIKFFLDDNIKNTNSVRAENFNDIIKRIKNIKNLISSASDFLDNKEKEKIKNIFEDEDFDIFTLRENLEYKKEKRKRQKEFFKKLDKIKKQEIYKAGIEGLNLIDDLLIYADNVQTTYAQISTEYGTILINKKRENNIYSDTYFIIIDYFGDDEYNFNKSNNDSVFNGGIVIDLEGNDRYYGNKNFSLGACFNGINIIYDKAGDDIYRTKNNYNIASAILGCAFIIDEEGDDIYSGNDYCLGASAFGIAGIIDYRGNDYYNSNICSQGFGSSYAAGFIMDFNGNDRYFSGGKNTDSIRQLKHTISLSQGMGYGLRPYGSGGVGILADFKGNDVYKSGVYGQGSAYFAALGILYDRSGDDQYISTRYSQGGAVHLSYAYLIDDNGDDLYFSWAVTQGCGHDYSFGFLGDKQGDDYYCFDSLGAGAGNSNGIGMFLDMKGRDIYAFKKDAQVKGYANFEPIRGLVGFGFFGDFEGDDIYFNDKNNAYREKGSIGIFLDSNFYTENWH